LELSEAGKNADSMSAKSIGSASRSLPQWDAVENASDNVITQDGAQIDAQAAHADHPAKVGSILSIVDTDQFARAIEEIERAAAALREGEPDLEPWTPGATPALEQPPRSIWLFVGTIWIATVLATGAATLAIASLL
jgi:hypothetical protein